MTFFEDWVDLDLNPIISFSSSSKIIYSNGEAQFLLSKINPKKIFEIALEYAPKTFGIKTSYVNLDLLNYTFYAITVRYENEDEIHIKLYKSAIAKKQNNLDMKKINLNNIFTLIDLSISSNKIKTNNTYIKDYDPSIPEFRIDANLFIKTLNQVFEAFKNSEKIKCSVMLKIGEYIKINDKKYSLISINISSNTKYNMPDIKDISSFILNYDDKKISIDLPLII